MATMEELVRLYEDYEKKAAEVRGKASAFAGAFNMGDDPRRHACHEMFYDAVGEWTAEFLAEKPETDQISRAVHWLLEAADAHRDQDVYWYMYAAQTHAAALIPLLPPEDCGQLLRWYDGAYPRLDRLPAQQQIVRLLKDHGADTKERKAGRRFPLFRRK